MKQIATEYKIGAQRVQSISRQENGTEDWKQAVPGDMLSERPALFHLRGFALGVASGGTPYGPSGLGSLLAGGAGAGAGATGASFGLSG